MPSEGIAHDERESRMALTEKDQQIFASVAVKGAVDLVAAGQRTSLDDTSSEIFGLLLDLAALAVGAQTPAAPAQAPVSYPAETPLVPHAEAQQTTEGAVQAVSAAFGATAIQPAPSDGPWYELFRDPALFFDNRNSKRNPKAPDFKAKNTSNIVDAKGEPAALWIDGRSTPDWVEDWATTLPV